MPTPNSMNADAPAGMSETVISAVSPIHGSAGAARPGTRPLLELQPVALGLTMLEAEYFWIATALYLAFVVASVVSSAVTIVGYRRGY